MTGLFKLVHFVPSGFFIQLLEEDLRTGVLGTSYFSRTTVRLLPLGVILVFGPPGLYSIKHFQGVPFPLNYFFKGGLRWLI